MSLQLEGPIHGYASIVRSPKSALLRLAAGGAPARPATVPAPPEEIDTARLLARGTILRRPADSATQQHALPTAMEQALKRALRNSGIYFKSCRFDLAGTAEGLTRILAVISEATLPHCAQRRSDMLTQLLFHIRRSPGGSISVLVYPVDSPSPWPEGKGFCNHNSSVGYQKAFTQALENFICRFAPQPATGHYSF